MNALKNIDLILNQPVGNFNIATSGVDAITIKITSPWKRSALQALTYFSRPMDFFIQLVCSPIFAFYQMAKKIGQNFKDNECIGLCNVALSPISFAMHFFK